MDRLGSLFSLQSQGSHQANGAIQFPGHFPTTNDSEQVDQSLTSTIGNFLNILVVKPVSIALFVCLSLLGKALRVAQVVSTKRPTAGNTTLNNALMNDPITRAEQFVRDLEENLLPLQQFALHHSDLNPIHLPPFFQGSYTQALYMASSRAKFLFIYLTNPMSEGSQSLFENVITNPIFLKIFERNEQAMIWGGNLTNSEAYQLANSLNITKFPMLGVLCLTRTTTMTPEGPVKSTPRISLVSKIQGGVSNPHDVESLIHNKFTKRMMKYEPDLALIRAELRDKYVSNLLRQKQDADYLLSLQRDKQKKAEAARKKLTQKYLQWRQPEFKDLLENARTQDVSRIAIKFEDRQRVTANFPKLWEISEIFVFVELIRKGMLEQNVELDLTESEAQVAFANFKLDFDFNLTSTIPPHRTLNDLDMSTKIESVEFISPSGLLMVELR